MPTKPLHGVRIIDLTRLLPGPMCTLHLADMGADVIKIEDTKMGDYARSIPPMQKKNSSFFLAVNRNKRSVALDLAKEEGRQVFLKLSETADVIVESFRPGVVKKLGIDYETIKKVNPKIIYCSISGYGQTGPYKDKAGHDLNYCSYAGIIKPEIRNPKSEIRNPKSSIPNFQIGDIVGGSLNAAMGILAALVQQKTTGQGQYIDVSIMDGTLAHCITALAFVEQVRAPLSPPEGGKQEVPPSGRAMSSEHRASIVEGRGAGFLSGALPCYNIYETKDARYIALAALEFKFWERFCEAVGRDDLILSHMVMGDEAEKIYKELSELFKTKTLEQWMDHFKDIDCCISPVLSLPETIKNEQVVARNTVVIKEHPEEGDVIQFSLPLKFSSFEFEIKKPAPLHGEHTEEVLADLGYSKRKIEEWKIKNII